MSLKCGGEFVLLVLPIRKMSLFCLVEEFRVKFAGADLAACCASVPLLAKVQPRKRPRLHALNTCGIKPINNIT